ncbi:HNH endonuclease signature motif containing protein [Sinomonas soli]
MGATGGVGRQRGAGAPRAVSLDGLPPDEELLAKDYEDYGFVDPFSAEGRGALPVIEDYLALVQALDSQEIGPESLDPAVLAIVAPHLAADRVLEATEAGSTVVDPAVLDPSAVTAGEWEALGIPAPRCGEDLPTARRALRLEHAAEIMRAIEETEVDQARLDAQRARLMAELVQLHERSGDLQRRLEAPPLAASEIAAALRVSQRTARARVEEARALADPLMAPVLDAMKAGRLTRQRAAAVLDAAIPVPSTRLADFAAAAAAIAAPEDPDRRPTLPALGQRLRRLAEDYCEEPLAARRAKAVADRRVDVAPTGDGMCYLTALLPLEVGAVVDTRLTAIARSLQSPAEARTINQLRADVLTDLLQHGPGRQLGSTPAVGGTHFASGTSGGAEPPLAWAPLAEAPLAEPPLAWAPLGGVRLQLVVTAPASTVDGTGDGPGEILGYGPIDPETTRRLAAQASTWTRLLVSARDGSPLSIGRIRYAPTAAMRRFLTVRDATCRFPGCDKPSAATEADHTVEWHECGQTDVRNLALLCPEHHRLKSLGLWTVRHLGAGAEVPATTTPHDPPAPPPHGPGPNPTAPPSHTPQTPPPGPEPPGTLEWTAPSGRRYVTRPYHEDPPPF